MTDQPNTCECCGKSPAPFRMLSGWAREGAELADLRRFRWEDRYACQECVPTILERIEQEAQADG